MTLNAGQQEVFIELQEFLASNHQFFSLESGGGFGKTYLLNFLENQIPELNKVRKVLQLPILGKMLYTATTNKAASLLGGDSKTIHKQFKIYPKTNYKTGKVTYNLGDCDDLYDEILVLDESSMLDPDIFQIIQSKLKQNAKVIFALDPYQLAPIGYAEPIVNQLVQQLGIPRAELTEPMRQDKDSHLFEVCQRLRQAVRDQVYYAPEQGTGIRHVDAQTFQAEYLTAFTNKEDARIISHSNPQVENHNAFVRKKLYDTSTFQVGDPVIAGSAFESCSDIKVENTYYIQNISPVEEDKYLRYHLVHLGLSQSFKIPADKHLYYAYLKRARAEGKSTGDWTTFYALKNTYLDIRDGFACTAHKAQGSTYDKVFLDFADLAICPDLNTFLRALYVAVSRARKEVVIYGI